MKKKVNDPNEVTEQMVDEACSEVSDEPCIFEYNALLVHTKPYQWINMKQPIKWYRQMLGIGRVLVIISCKEYKDKIKSNIKAIASIIDEHNKCVKVMCE